MARLIVAIAALCITASSHAQTMTHVSYRQAVVAQVRPTVKVWTAHIGNSPQYDLQEDPAPPAGADEGDFDNDAGSLFVSAYKSASANGGDDIASAYCGTGTGCSEGTMSATYSVQNYVSRKTSLVTVKGATKPGAKVSETVQIDGEDPNYIVQYRVTINTTGPTGSWGSAVGLNGVYMLAWVDDSNFVAVQWDAPSNKWICAGFRRDSSGDLHLIEEETTAGANWTNKTYDFYVSQPEGAQFSPEITINYAAEGTSDNEDDTWGHFDLTLSSNGTVQKSMLSTMQLAYIGAEAGEWEE